MIKQLSAYLSNPQKITISSCHLPFTNLGKTTYSNKLSRFELMLYQSWSVKYKSKMFQLQRETATPLTCNSKEKEQLPLQWNPTYGILYVWLYYPTSEREWCKNSRNFHNGESLNNPDVDKYNQLVRTGRESDGRWRHLSFRVIFTNSSWIRIFS